MAKKQTMLVLAWAAVALLGVLTGTVALRPAAAVAGQASVETAPSALEAPAAALGTILSAASYEGLPGGLPAASSEGLVLFVPHMALGDLNSTLFIQNPAQDLAYVVVSFYAADGSFITSAELTIPARGSQPLEAAAVPGLPAGFEGSAVIESDQPVQAVVNLQAAAADSLLSYTVVPGGSTEAILLGIVRNYSGWNTSFWIQNVGQGPADVAMSYRSVTGFQYHATDTIPALASHVYRQADMPELGTSFMGNVIVTAGAPVVVVVESWHSTTASAGAYNGISPAGTGPEFLFPRQQKAVAGWSSAVQITNLGSQVAELFASWYSDIGALQHSDVRSVPPGSLYTYALAGMSQIPTGFDGTARVEATEPLAAIASSRNQAATGDGFATTDGLELGQLATTAYLPRVAHVVAAGLSTELSIQNVGGEDAAVTVTFYDQRGTTTATVSDSIPPNGAARYDTAAVPDLGSDWQGSAIVDATQPIAVEAMQVIQYVPPPCDALSGVAIDGPTSGDAGTPYTFTAVITPATATLPITYTWTPAPDSGQATSTAEYAWVQPGTYSLTVTAENCGGLVGDSHVIVVGSVVTATVDPVSGGSLVYTGTQGLTTTVQVPAGAVDEPIDLVYSPQEPESPPAGFAFAGQGFQLEAFQEGELVPGVVFSLPVTITIQYSDADVAGIDEGALALTYWTGSEWEDAACGPVERNTEDNWLAVPICHLSRFGLLGKTSYRVYLPLVIRAEPGR